MYRHGLQEQASQKDKTDKAGNGKNMDNVNMGETPELFCKYDVTTCISEYMKCL